MKKLLVLMTAGILCASIASAEAIEKSFNVPAGGLLEIDLDTGGPVEIIGGRGGNVTVKADVSGRDADRVDVRIERTTRGVKVESEYARAFKNNRASARFTITVPRQFDIELESRGGDVKIENVSGKIEGSTMGGELDLSSLEGTVNLSTMGGNITLVSSRVDGEVSTMGGKVLIRDVVGDLKGKSMGGNVIYENVTTPSGSTGKAVVISTMGGRVDVSNASAGADLSTMGGDVTVGSAKEYVKAKTMGGDILIKSVDGWVKATTMGGNIDVTVVGDPNRGDHSVQLDSKGGEIVLTVPSEMSMDLDIQLDYTKNSSREFKIVSDFPVAIRESSEWSYSRGTPRKTISATGTVAGGKNKIVIRTINGNVYLKKK